MHHFMFSTVDHHGLQREPRVTVVLDPPNDVRVAYGYNHLEFNEPTLEYTLPFEQAFPTFRRFLDQLWKETMPEAIPYAGGE